MFYMHKETIDFAHIRGALAMCRAIDVEHTYCKYLLWSLLHLCGDTEG